LVGVRCSVDEAFILTDLCEVLGEVYGGGAVGSEMEGYVLEEADAEQVVGQ